MNMKQKHFLSVLLLMISSVTYAQNVTSDFLKSASWTWERLDRKYVFTDDSIYMCSRLKSYGTTSEPYYLSSKPQLEFRDELVGKNKKGKYIIVKSHETTPGITLCFKVLFVLENGITLQERKLDNEYDRMVLTKNNSEKYDTLRLSCSYKELAYKHDKQSQQAFFNAFPSTWYDFERTFNGAFFTNDMSAEYKQDLSHDFEKYLDAFDNLSVINTKDYYSKLIDVTIGMPQCSTPASDKWQGIVAAKIATNKKLVSKLLDKKSKFHQTRFWQFVQRKDKCCQKGVTARGGQNRIKEIWRRGIIGYDTERLYLTDSVCYYVTDCSLGSSKLRSAAPYRVTEEGDLGNDNAIVMTRVQNEKYGTLLQLKQIPGEKLEGTVEELPVFQKRQSSLVTDTALMAASYRAMVLGNIDHREAQRLFFESFPSTWSDFYAVMISDEDGNKGMYRHAPEYIAAFEKLDCIPAHDLLKKMVTISINAIPQDPISKQWRTVVSNLSARYQDELNRVLQEFEPWQQTSFRQFIEN